MEYFKKEKKNEILPKKKNRNYYKTDIKYNKKYPGEKKIE